MTRDDKVALGVTLGALALIFGAAVATSKNNTRTDEGDINTLVAAFNDRHGTDWIMTTAADILAATAAAVLPPPFNIIFTAVYTAEQAALNSRLPKHLKLQHALAVVRRSSR